MWKQRKLGSSEYGWTVIRRFSTCRQLRLPSGRHTKAMSSSRTPSPRSSRTLNTSCRHSPWPGRPASAVLEITRARSFQCSCAASSTARASTTSATSSFEGLPRIEAWLAPLIATSGVSGDDHGAVTVRWDTPAPRTCASSARRRRRAPRRPARGGSRSPGGTPRPDPERSPRAPATRSRRRTTRRRLSHAHAGARARCRRRSGWRSIRARVRSVVASRTVLLESCARTPRGFRVERSSTHTCFGSGSIV